MSWFQETIVDSVTDLVTGFGDAIDKNVTSDEERLILKKDMEAMVYAFKTKLLEAEAKGEEERTKRWESDNKSVSKLNRVIRPYTLIYLTLVISALAVTDGNIGEFIIKGAYVSLFEMAFIVTLGGYFTLRTYEKTKGLTV